MTDRQQAYKRYSTHVKRNNILLLKQKDTLPNQHLQDQNQNQPQNNQSPFKDNIIFKPSEQKNLEPLVLKRFEEYFKKSIENTKNTRIFNQFIQHQTVKTDKKRKNQKLFTYTSTNISSLIQTENNLERKKFIKERKQNLSSISKYELRSSIDEKHKTMILDQSITDPNLPDVKLKPLNLISQRRKRQTFNKSIDLSKLLNKTLTQNDKKIESQFITLVSKMQEEDYQKQDYLKIQSSILVDRKVMSPVLKSPHMKKTLNKEEIRKSLRKKVENRNQVFQRIYKEKIRSRSPSPSKIARKVNFLDFINPSKRQQFTLMDVIKVSLVNSQIEEVKFHMNGCFFSVYVQQGNNGDLIKLIVRGTNGWRVSELIQVSNLVWTQNYRKNLSDKKPKRIFKKSLLQAQNVKSRSKQRSNSDFKDSQEFLLSRVFLRKNSGSKKSLTKKSLQKLTNIELKYKGLDDLSSKNYPELSLLKHRTQFQQTSYESQLRKLLPQDFHFQNFVLKSQKDAKKITINPNLLIHNHLIGHRAISDKKNLLFNLKKFYSSQKINPFQFIPQSHDIFAQDDEYILKQNENFVKNQQQCQVMKKETWIVKPGQDSNRGRGIVICKGWDSVMVEIGKRFKENKPLKRDNQIQVRQIPESSKIADEKLNQKNYYFSKRSIILQRYITPLLYQGRKFDIRSYMLVTWVNNVLNGYFYEQCYIRTSSKPFDIQSQNKYVHLTNDAVQNLSHDYGKYEEGNKVSQILFSKYFQSLSDENKKSWGDIKNEMSQRCKQTLKSSSKKLVGRFRHGTQSSLKQAYGFRTDKSSLKLRQTQRSQSKTSQKGSFLFPNNQSKQEEISFQLFGLDFMIDQNKKLWLIEVNTNPAITHDCSRVLNRLIPKLLDNTFAIAVMPLMRPSRVPENIQYQNRYHHIFQEKIHE